MNTRPRLLRIVLITILLSTFGVGGAQIKGKHDILTLSWMAGSWSGISDGIEMEENWTEPKGGSMLGVHRDVRNGRTISFEFMRIQDEAEALTLWASPGGKPAVPFRAIEVTSERVTFENKEHDFPQRVIYWRTTDDRLHARIEGTIKGKTESEEWSWKKVLGSNP